MKGQYLAIESVMALGMGLVIAIGTVSIFTSYRDGVMETGEQRQVDIVESELTDAVYSLSSVDSGSTEIELPGKIAGKDYTTAFQDGLVVKVGTYTYKTDLGDLEYSHSFRGSAEGGSVKIFKRGNEFTLRAN